MIRIQTTDLESLSCARIGMRVFYICTCVLVDVVLSKRTTAFVRDRSAAMDDTETEPAFSMEQFLDEMKEAGGCFLVDRETGERFHKLLAYVEDACVTT